MTLLIGGLAVYKVIHIITSALPKKLNGWVIVLSGAILGIITSVFISSENVVFSGLAMATIASATHSVLRLVTLVGDSSIRQSFQ